MSLKPRGAVRADALIVFDARGGAHPHSLTRVIPDARPSGQLSAVKAASCGLYLLLAQKKRTKEKGPRRLAPCCRKGFPALLALSGAHELAGYAHSNMHALHPETAAMLGGVNGSGAHEFGHRGLLPHGAALNHGAKSIRDQTAWPHKRGMNTPVKLRSAPSPWCSRAPQVENGPARGLSDRPQGGSSAAPVFCRGAQGSRSVAETKPWGAVSFAFFSLGMQRKEGRVCAAAHIKIKPARKREQNHRHRSKMQSESESESESESDTGKAKRLQR